MESVSKGGISALDDSGTQLHVKQESENEILNDLINEPLPSAMASDRSFERFKIELESEDETMERPHKKRRKDKKNYKNSVKNGRIEDGKNVGKKYSNSHPEGKSELTELPCIVNIKPSVTLGRPSQENHNRTVDTADQVPSNRKKTCESNGHAVNNKAIGKNTSNDKFASKVYKMLVDIQSTLKDLKAEVTENSKKIDQIHKLLPQPVSCTAFTKNEFNFPIPTDEKLLEFEKQLQKKETATKLVVQLSSRTYSTWREMVLICLKHMLTKNVAVLYNLNGRKGSKKKFRDLNICNILVESVQYKFKDAPTEEVLRRISLVLAGAMDWDGSRYKENKLKECSS